MACGSTATASEAAVSDEDFLQQGFSKMISSFHEFHADGPATAGQSLEEFAESLSSSTPAKPAKAAPQQSGQQQDRSAQVHKGNKPRRSKADDPQVGRGAGASEEHKKGKGRSGTKPKFPQNLVEDSSEPRGPVPGPFATSAAASAASIPAQLGNPVQTAVPQEAASTEVKPEDYGKWADYYRQCADYFTKCGELAASGQNPSDVSGAACSAQAQCGPAGSSHSLAAMPRTEAGSSYMGCSAQPAVGLPYPSVAASLKPQQATPAMAQPPAATSGLPGTPGTACSAAAAAQGDEALANLLMAWYFSGYYTGLYAAQKGGK